MKTEKIIQKLKRRFNLEDQPACSAKEMFAAIVGYLKQIDTSNKPANMGLWKRIEAIKGIGPKLADEIIEEYDNSEQIVQAIKTGEFQVGGLGPKREIMLLEALK